MELTEKQLSKFKKDDIIQFLIQSAENEKQLRKEVSELTRELKRTNQQMQLIIEKWNLAQADRFGRSTEKKFLRLQLPNSQQKSSKTPINNCRMIVKLMYMKRQLCNWTLIYNT